MLPGVLYALLAGIMWGLVFVGPLIVPDYSAALQSTGRYLALGIIALPIAWLGRQRMRTLTRKDWFTALKLSLFGNLVYYLCLASAIQRTGSPVATMIIGTLPVVIPIFANLLYSKRDGKLPWRRLAPSLAAILLGLVMVNIAELRNEPANFSVGRYISGIFLAACAVACWAWFALRNARWLRENPEKNPMMWATAQGLSTLPVSLAGYLLVSLWTARETADFVLPFGPRPLVFVSLMLVIAILCSWVGNLCWNIACQRLPTVIAGSLMVFEILTGLAYAFILRQSWPPLLTAMGILCLVSGVLLAITARPEKRPRLPAEDT